MAPAPAQYDVSYYDQDYYDDGVAPFVFTGGVTVTVAQQAPVTVSVSYRS